MTKLSVNINKIALIRNSRGGNNPDILKIAKDCESFGAQGITVHPRPNERHIRYQDVYDLKEIVSTELNVEGNPTDKFMEVVLAARPHQVTLVPDSPEALTSNNGWDTINNASFLRDVISTLKKAGIRTSIFINPDIRMVKAALDTETDRIELYTEPYAENYYANKDGAILHFIEAAKCAGQLGIGINAGHDLNLDNLAFFQQNVPGLLEVSIGHALVSDSLYYGLEATIGMYLERLK
jgi:pyridoxine 5-phosphate synthase